MFNLCVQERNYYVLGCGTIPGVFTSNSMSILCKLLNSFLFVPYNTSNLLNLSLFFYILYSIRCRHESNLPDRH